MSGRPDARREGLLLDAMIGAIAGIAATAAMTAAAARLFRDLSPAEQYPLPPRELTDRALEAAGLDRRVAEPEVEAATVASHFGFGALVGALYGALRPAVKSSVPTGIGYTLAIWTMSYLGWIPALRMLHPATAHPARRNRLMIAVHVIYGGTLGAVANALHRSMRPLQEGPARDAPDENGSQQAVHASLRYR